MDEVCSRQEVSALFLKLSLDRKSESLAYRQEMWKIVASGMLIEELKMVCRPLNITD